MGAFNVRKTQPCITCVFFVFFKVWHWFKDSDLEKVLNLTTFDTSYVSSVGYPWI